MYGACASVLPASLRSCDGRQVAHLLQDSLGPAIDSITKQELDSVYKQVFKFLLSIWECREAQMKKTTQKERNGSSSSSTAVMFFDAMELAAVSVFKRIVLRLSDVAFKPMLWKLLDWANATGTKTGQACRIHVVYVIVNALVRFIFFAIFQLSFFILSTFSLPVVLALLLSFLLYVCACVDIDIDIIFMY